MNDGDYDVRANETSGTVGAAMWPFTPNVEELERQADVVGLVAALGCWHRQSRSNAARALHGQLTSPTCAFPIVKAPLGPGARAFLEAFGLTGGLTLVTPTKEYAHWIPLVTQLLEQEHYCWPPSRHDDIAANVEEFFANLCFAEAIPFFSDALECKYCVIHGTSSTRSVGERSYSDTWEMAGSVGSVYDVTGTVTVTTEELTYQLKYPAGDGTRRAAMTLKGTTPALAMEIERMLTDSMLPSTYVETRDSEAREAEHWQKIGDNR